MKPTHTFNGRSSLEDKPKENIYSGLHASNRRIEERESSLNFFDSDNTERSYRLEPTKYYSYNPYNTPKSYDNWSYNTMVLHGSHRSSLSKPDKYAHRMSFPSTENQSTRRSSNKYSKKNSNARPKPLQLENEKYYDLVFPKQRIMNFTNSDFKYQPRSLDKAEL